MTLQEFFEQVKDLPPETPVCVAEEDEAAAMNVSGVEVVQGQRRSAAANGAEAVGLDGDAGMETVVVLRW